MVVIDIIRCFALRPVLDFSTNTEKLKRTHKHFNCGYQFFVVLTMVWITIFTIIKWKSNKSFSLDNLTNLFTILLWIYMGAVALGILFQVIQCLEKTNQPDVVKDVKSPIIEFKEPKQRGRTSLPRVEEGENPLKDDLAQSAFDAVMDILGNNLSSSDAGNILNSLISCKDTFLRKDYEKVSLADWLYHNYRSHFKPFEPKSMTTASGLNQDKQDSISKQLKNKYLEKKEKK